MDPPNLAGTQGQSLQVTTKIHRSAITVNDVVLALENPPVGIRGVFNPDPANGDSSVLTLIIDEGAVPGGYEIHVAGRDSSFFATASVKLTVAGRRSSTAVVDRSLRPNQQALPPLEDGRPRQLARVVDAKGHQADFVHDEIIVVTEDAAVLSAIVNRWRGTVLKTIRPTDYGVNRTKTIHLVRIDSTAADTLALARDLATINPNVRGDFRVSSEEGLSLVAAAAYEAARGARVEINWVAQPSVFENKISPESPVGPATGGYDSNAFNWGYMTTKTGNHIGVADAWRVLEQEGKLGNKIKIAVLDAGFSTTADYPSNVQFFTVNSGKKMGDPGSSSSPWHGSRVAQTVAAVPANAFGTAGVAGPVADLILVYVDGDLFDTMAAVWNAAGAGARIINISAHVSVPAALTLAQSSGVGVLNDVTADTRADGILIFASAGNEGVNVDAYDGAWEEAWYAPCENDGVICVGGEATAITAEAASQSSDYSNSDSRSNYGPEQVNLYAPFSVFAGADPTNSSGRAFIVEGTSFASPFAAGVAALIWAAKPELTADEVESLLFTWAHVLDDNGKKSVNALSPVKHLLVSGANYPPVIEITSPAAGAKVGYGGLAMVDFAATTTDFEDEDACCTVTWTSDKDGLIGTGRSFQYTFSSPGWRWIVAEAKDSKGAGSQDYLLLEVKNTPPLVAIVTPVPGEIVYKGSSKPVKGTVSDANEPLTGLCSSARWTFLEIGSMTYNGCHPTIAFTALGDHTLAFTGKDSDGATATAKVTVHVVNPPVSGPPDVTIYSPKHGQLFDVGDNVILNGLGIDPDTKAAVPYSAQAYRWSIIRDGGQIAITPTISGWGIPYFTPSDYVAAGCPGGTKDAELWLRVTDLQGEYASQFVPISVLVPPC